MTGRPGLYQKTLPVALPRGCWHLLAKLVVVIGYHNIQRGYGPPTLTDALGVLVTKALTEIAEVTERRFNEIRTEIAVREIPAFYTQAQLDTIAASPAAAVFDAVRLSWRTERRHRTQASAERKLIRSVCERPTRLAERLAATAQFVRVGSVRVTARDSQWLQAVLGLVPGGSQPPRQGDA